METQTTEAKRLSLKEVRELAGGVSHTYVYSHIKKGNLPVPEKWGRMSRWRYSDVVAWINSLKTLNN